MYILYINIIYFLYIIYVHKYYILHTYKSTFHREVIFVCFLSQIWHIMLLLAPIWSSGHLEAQNCPGVEPSQKGQRSHAQILVSAVLNRVKHSTHRGLSALGFVSSQLIRYGQPTSFSHKLKDRTHTQSALLWTNSSFSSSPNEVLISTTSYPGPSMPPCLLFPLPFSPFIVLLYINPCLDLSTPSHLTLCTVNPSQERQYLHS